MNARVLDPLATARATVDAFERVALPLIAKFSGDAQARVDSAVAALAKQMDEARAHLALADREQLVFIREHVAAEVAKAVDAKPVKEGPPGPPGELPRITVWRKETEYHRGNVVLCRAGVWECVAERVLSEPGSNAEEPEWRLLFGGVFNITRSVTGVRTFVDTFEMSDGTGYELITHHALPVHLGTWDPSYGYARGDEVAFDGCSWRCVADEVEPGDGPPSAAWQLVAKQGRRGRDGKPGHKGDPGPKGDPGRAGVVWRGLFEDGAIYKAGDLARFKNSVFICVADTSLPPGVDKSWDTFVEGPANV